MAQALQRAYQGRGGVLHQNSTVERIVIENGTATGVQTQDGFHSSGYTVFSPQVAGLDRSDGLPDTMIPPVRPVKGQMLALRMQDGTTIKTSSVPSKRKVSDTGIFSAENRR